LQTPLPNHYAALGLHRRCTAEQIRVAYRLLAKQHHPDLNGGSVDSIEQTQALNAAHEVLGDPDRRKAYDRELSKAESPKQAVRPTRIQKNLAQDVHLRLEDFLRGTRLDVRVQDPANPDGAETYSLDVSPGTAPGARFRIAREGYFRGGVVTVRVKPRPDPRFKVRGSDLRCDLRISADRAAKGGSESVRSLNGSLRVTITAGIGRGEEVRIPGEGLPKPRGGRGDLLVRIDYRPEVRITRSSGTR
jgi:curved DNA-binding protein